MSKPICQKCVECSKISFRGVEDKDKPGCWIVGACTRKRNYYKNIDQKRTYYRQKHHYIKYCTGVCALCKSTEKIEVHHIQPQLNGGEHTINNTMTLCNVCHGIITNYYKAIRGIKQVEEYKML